MAYDGAETGSACLIGAQTAEVRLSCNDWIDAFRCREIYHAKRLDLTNVHPLADSGGKGVAPEFEKCWEARVLLVCKTGLWSRHRDWWRCRKGGKASVDTNKM